MQYEELLLSFEPGASSSYLNLPSHKHSLMFSKPFVLLTLMILVSSCFFVIALRLQNANAQSPSEEAGALASRYAPVLHFTSEEKFYPTTVDYVISNSELMLRSGDGAGSSLVDANPSVASLGSDNDPNMFLNNKLNTFDAIAADYAQKSTGLGYTAYVHVTNNVIQYWLLYAYNNGPLNNHQSDWEVVEVFLDGSGNPQSLLLSQHLNGENVAWDDVELSGTHPVVYVAQGSHANYFRAYQGKIGIENDVVSADGPAVNPSQLNLVMLGEHGNHPSNQGWLDFSGRWGYWGTDTQVAAGDSGPYGPVFNENGIRWGDSSGYLSQTLHVNGYYFILAWVCANVLLLLVIYFVARAAWKTFGIMRTRSRNGLLVGHFLRGRGLIGVAIALIGILITLVALFLPWYSVSASSSQSGPLVGGVNLLKIDGIHGMSLNMFLGQTTESSSGYQTFLSTEIPFALFFLFGLILVALDIIGMKKARSLGMKFVGGAITSLLPFILIYIFITLLPDLVPMASALFPGQSIPPGVTDLARSVASNPISGTSSQTFDVVGNTTINWGFEIGAYLFVIAAVIRIVGGAVVMTSPNSAEKTLRPPPASPTTLPPLTT